MNHQGVGTPGQSPARHNVSQDSTPGNEKVESYTSETPTLTRALSREEIEENRRDEEVHQLARRYTSKSHHSVYDDDPFNPREGSPLDPASENFSPRAYAKALLNLQARDPEKSKQRTAGFAF